MFFKYILSDKKQLLYKQRPNNNISLPHDFFYTHTAIVLQIIQSHLLRTEIPHMPCLNPAYFIRVYRIMCVHTYMCRQLLTSET
jgi:hypothetical protein